MKNAPQMASADPQERQAGDSQRDLPLATSIQVANSTASMSVQSADGVVVHPIPALDGFGLLVMAALLGVAALWIWRRQQ